MTVLYTSAYAKLNLYLDVIGKREDGYHNIESLMQAVTLRDDMERRKYSLRQPERIRTV